MMRGLAAIGVAWLLLGGGNAATQAQQGARADVAGQLQQGGGSGQASQSQQPSAPFVLSAGEQAELDQLLDAWQEQSAGTKHLQAKFRRWQFEPQTTPAATIHKTWAEGVIKYSAPDKGLFRVDQLKTFAGVEDGKSIYRDHEGQYGEYWVCNGQELLEFDRAEKKCTIQQLPPEMQGKEILESPLPFVFNLNAELLKQRYWIRRLESPNNEVILMEAHPKRQADRAQYRFVRIVINAKTFLPQALILYAPNFDPPKTVDYQHYEFMDVERNTLRQGLANWTRGFIEAQPPKDWTVIREKFRPEPAPHMAQPGNDKTLR